MQIPWLFPDFSQYSFFSLTFNKIPWLFPDFCQVWNFPDFSLTAGHPDIFLVVRLDKLIVEQTAEFTCFAIELTTELTLFWDGLTHLSLDKIVAISQMTFSNAFSWIKNFKFWLKFYWNLFLRVHLTINPALDNGLAPNRWQVIIWTNAHPIHWRRYAALGADGLMLN